MASLRLTWFHLVPLGFTWLHLHSLGLTWSNFDCLEPFWLHVASLGFTLTFVVSFEPTWFHLASLDFAWFHVDSLGFTGSHFVCLGLNWSHLYSFGLPGFPKAQEENSRVAKREKGRGRDANLKPVPTLHPERAHARTNRNRNRFPGWTHPPTSATSKRKHV